VAELYKNINQSTITSLLTVWKRSADTFISSEVTILRIKPHFMYHENYNQELISEAIFGFSTLNWRGINYFGYGYILCVDQCIWCYLYIFVALLTAN